MIVPMVIGVAVDSGGGSSPWRRVIAHHTQRPQPLSRMRAARTHDHERVWSARDEHLEDLGEGEEFATYLMHLVAPIGDVKLVRLHAGPSGGG